jgi:hypothetical protein
MCLQALQGFDERDLPFLPRSPHVGNTSKHLDISVAINDFPLQLMPCKTLQAVKQLLGCPTIMLVKPRDGRFAAQGPMSVVSADRLYGFGRLMLQISQTGPFAALKAYG